MKRALVLWALLCGAAQAQIGPTLGNPAGPGIGPSLPSAIGTPEERAWWQTGPLLTADGGTVAHVYWRGGALVDAKGNSWTQNGTVPQVAASGFVPPGAGPFTTVNFYSLGSGSDVLDIATAWTVVVVGKLTSDPGGFVTPLSTTNGVATGYLPLIASGSLSNQTYVGASSSKTSSGAKLGTPFVMCSGYSGGTAAVMMNLGDWISSGVTYSLDSTTPSRIGVTAGGAYQFPGTIYEILVSSTSPTENLCRSWVNSAIARMKVSWGSGVVVLGDSITAGAGVTTPYPQVLANSKGSGYGITNAGITGNTTAQMSSRWTTRYNSIGAATLVVLGGVNDAQTDVPAATILANLTAIYDDARARGIRVVPCTIMPWGSGVNWTAPRETITETVNAGILAYCSTYSLTCVDLFNSALNNGSNVLAPAYAQADGVHPNQAGSNLIASLIAAAIP